MDGGGEADAACVSGGGRGGELGKIRDNTHVANHVSQTRLARTCVHGSRWRALHFPTLKEV